MSESDLTSQIKQTLALMEQGLSTSPRSAGAKLLDQLFETLQDEDEGPSRAEAEGLIWTLWCSHEDRSAQRSMNRAIGAMARQELALAEELLNELIGQRPEWAEAWNKRATLHYLRGENLKSISDIQRTLELEPRHFGAMSGFGQICLRVGDETSAWLAFEHALRVNPGLDSVREAVTVLRARVVRTLH